MKVTTNSILFLSVYLIISIDAYRYVGCFEISQTENVNTTYGPSIRNITGLSVETCIAICSMQGYRYAGLQDAVICRCTDTTTDSYVQSKVAEYHCSLRCPGEQYDICGGDLYSSVFDIRGESRYHIIKTGASLTWSSAKKRCKALNMTLPSLTESDVASLIQADRSMVGRYIWLDGRCGWNLQKKGTTGGLAGGAPCVFPFTYKGVEYNSCTKVEHNKPWCYTTKFSRYDPTHRLWGICPEDRSLKKLGMSTNGYRFQINNKSGKKNCLALHCRDHQQLCMVKDYYCNQELPYFCPNLWHVEPNDCPDNFMQFQRYMHISSKYRSCYSKANYTWAGALENNLCGGENYVNTTLLADAFDSFIYLNSTSKYYWTGAGEYTCETREGAALPVIQRDNNVDDGDCYSFFIADRSNSTHTGFKLTKKAIGCSIRPLSTLVCQDNNPDGYDTTTARASITSTSEETTSSGGQSGYTQSTTTDKGSSASTVEHTTINTTIPSNTTMRGRTTENNARVDPPLDVINEKDENKTMMISSIVATFLLVTIIVTISIIAIRRKKLMDKKARSDTQGNNYTNPAYNTSMSQVTQSNNHGNRITLAPPLTTIDEQGYAEVLRVNLEKTDVGPTGETIKRDGYLTMGRGSTDSASFPGPPIPESTPGKHQNRESMIYAEMDNMTSHYSDPHQGTANTLPLLSSQISPDTYDVPLPVVRTLPINPARTSAIYGEIDDIFVSNDQLSLLEEDYSCPMPKTDAATLTPGVVPPLSLRGDNNGRKSNDAIEDEGVYSLAEDVVEDEIVTVENDLYVPSS